MNTKFRLLAIALVVAIFSVQCTHNDSDIPKIPTTIEQNFKAGSSTHEGITLQYQESAIASSKAGKSALVVVLHGQYANGSDNKSQLRQDAMIRVWHHLSSNKIKSIMLAPQCVRKVGLVYRHGDARRFRRELHDGVANHAVVASCRVARSHDVKAVADLEKRCRIHVRECF